MTERGQGFVLVPDSDENEAASPARGARLLGLLRALLPSAPEAGPPGRPRLVFGFDATASREPAWEVALSVTDALFAALPGALDVALAVHGGSRLHTFTPFTNNPNSLRDRAASVRCAAGQTRLLAILSSGLKQPGVRVIVYIGDVFEESPDRGRRIADLLGQQGTRLIIFHDTSDWQARRDREMFEDLARRTGGCVLPFDRDAPDRLRDLLAAIAIYAVGGLAMLQDRRGDLPGAVALLENLAQGP